MKRFLLFCLIVLSQCGWGWPNGWNIGPMSPSTIVYPVSSSTTNQTLVPGQSGNVIVMTGTSAHTQFTLPTGTVGMTYTFVDDTTNFIAIIPQATDTIEIASTTIGVGVKNSTSTAIGNNITVVCRNPNFWSISNQSGTWTTGS